ncbi:putative nucleotide-diphospho-sugar transferase [Oceaniovalibus guishaninsula]|nr:putative nucleotide-diphospho-sugar transferase [Oceaniovalibus guishaninsula]
MGDDERGIVLAATGARYTVIARRAARSARKAMPGTPIDLFTDQDLDDPVFARIHRLDVSHRRPKFEAMERTRFARTLMIDADVLLRHDVSELFDVLDRYDIAAVPGISRAPDHLGGYPDLPRSVPVINTGVMAFRGTGAVRAFARDWQAEMIRTGAKMDQPAFRKLIYESDLRFLALGIEYNVIYLQLLNVWRHTMGGVRVLHVRAFHTGDPGDPEQPLDPRPHLSVLQQDHLEALDRVDWTLGGQRRFVPPPIAVYREAFARRIGTVEHAGFRAWSLYRRLLGREKGGAKERDD